MGELTGVLFHVGPLNVDGEDGAVLQLNVQGPVSGDGLIVLGGLEVLGGIGVEVVLAGKMANGRNLAAQYQAQLNS